VALTDLSPEDWLKRLIHAHDDCMADLRLMDAYYEGTQPLSYLAPELINELSDRMRQMVINWPQLVVDALDERLDVEGFRYSDSEQAEKDLWKVWQANCMDEGSQQAHVDALALKRSYAIVGEGDSEDTPIISAESALDVYAERDPRTRRVLAAIKRWEEPGAPGTEATKWANLYLPDQRITFAKAKGRWSERDTDKHGLGEVLVVPLANRPRLRHIDGTSELAAILPISDAACKIASDMMVSAEYHAMPRRWATGVSKDDFADANGNPMGAMSSLAGRVWSNESKEVKYGQFPEAQLANFHETINLLARLVSSLTGLPPAFLGLASAQPPSADAIRASEARLVKRAERRQRSFGEAWERTMRLVMLVRDGKGNVDPRAMQLETIWRDPATPTFAQKADAVVKLKTAGLLPEEAAWEELGYSATKIARLKQMRDEELTRITTMDLHALSTAHEGDQPPVPQPDAVPPAGVPPAPQPAAAGG
jgi:hypothetical protein